MEVPTATLTKRQSKKASTKAAPKLYSVTDNDLTSTSKLSASFWAVATIRSIDGKFEAGYI